MAISETILPEFDQEMAGARRTLERVPDEKFGWKPHAKSFSMGNLAIHLANIPSWAAMTLERDELDIAPVGGTSWKEPEAKNRKELLEMFDKNVAQARASIAAASDEVMHSPWSLLAGGQKLLTRPKSSILRDFVLNHLIHHRAQLGVYLRLNDIPVPAIYGPSADEEN